MTSQKKNQFNGLEESNFSVLEKWRTHVWAPQHELEESNLKAAVNRWEVKTSGALHAPAWMGSKKKGGGTYFQVIRLKLG